MWPAADNPVRGKIIQFPGVESHCYNHDTFDISKHFAPAKVIAWEKTFLTLQKYFPMVDLFNISVH